MQTERVTFLTTPAAKAELVARAAARGVSIGEYIRRRVEEDADISPEQRVELESLVRQVNETLPKMEASLDGMIESLRETHHYVEAKVQELSRRS